MRSLLAVVMLAGCFPPGVYVCDGDASCDAGVCEANGFCSHEDDACPSGRRYSALAGDGLANACVDPMDPSTTGSSTTHASSSSTSSASSSSEETTAPIPDVAPVCGDGRVEGDEACDDENLVPGDGCSEDCRASGSVLWEFVVGDPFHGSDAALEVAILAPDDIVVAGNHEIADDEYIAFYARHRATDGERAWERMYDSPAPSDSATAIVVNGSNDIIVGGTSGTYPDSASSWARYVAPDGSTTWTVIPDLVSIRGMAANGGGAILAGRGLIVPTPASYGAVALNLRETDGATLWRAEFPDAGAFPAVARVADDDSFFATSSAGDIGLVRGGAAGLVQIDAYAEPFGGEDAPQAIAVFGGAQAVALAGYVNTASGPDWWIRMYDDAQAPVWTRSETESPLAFSDEIEALAFGPDGAIHALGFVTRVDKDVFVAKFDAAGELVWSRTLPDEADNVGDDIGRGLAIALDGSLVAVGERSLDPGDRDAWVAKIVP